LPANKGGKPVKAIILEDQCTGCGICPNICPDVFELEGAVASVKTNPVPDGLVDECRDAAESCPVQAIELTG
jgi:ferredoxin